MAPSYRVGVWIRRQNGRREGSRVVRVTCQVIAQLKMKSPDVNSGDQVVGDRQNKHIAEDEGGADYEGGRRDHREGVQEHPNSPVPVKIALLS